MYNLDPREIIVYLRTQDGVKKKIGELRELSNHFLYLNQKNDEFVVIPLEKIIIIQE